MNKDGILNCMFNLWAAFNPFIVYFIYIYFSINTYTINYLRKDCCSNKSQFFGKKQTERGRNGNQKSYCPELDLIFLTAHIRGDVKKVVVLSVAHHNRGRLVLVTDHNLLLK